ncbi:MAG TPA: double-strand break repair protein AddB [Xanthobacteraceae bacterium]|nr:double-strand break repair protein AddB [Xanthobacteraceae bacterium]
MSGDSPKARVFTVPASVPFLPTLVRALVDGALVPGFAPGTDPLALSAATLYLPTRRACRLARDIFLDVLGSEAALLPRVVPIGDIDEDEIAFAEIATGAAAADALDLPPALGGLTRRMLLARLVLAWAQRLKPSPGDQPLVVGTPAAALALADDLAHLMDDLATREIDWSRLDGLVPEHVDRYWQLTLDFLKIAREAWPEILKERDAIEPAARRDRLINAEAARLAAASGGPVIAAGSTGSMPATAKLLATIAALPHGAVVLPGLDTDLDDDAWELIGAGGDDESWPAFGHPQFAMHGLLARIGIGRAQVAHLQPPGAHGREVLLSEALRPARATDRWQERLREVEDELARGIADIAMIEAANAEEEALAIAVALRGALERPGKTAALVTPDRALARRVLAALGRWSIAADDSGGDALADTPAGVLARLTAEAALTGIPPVALLAVMKHALFRLDAPAGDHTKAIAALERAILRGPRPRAGSSGLAHALATFRRELAKLRAKERSEIHAAEPRAMIADGDLAAAATLVERFAAALAPLERLAVSEALPFRAIAAAHREVIANLTRDDVGDCSAFAEADGTALTQLFDEIAEDSAADMAVAPAHYGETLEAVMAGRVVRRPGAPDARVHIYGPLEARLTQADCVVIGGLVEGVWPPEPRSDPWLNRPMRLQLGLDLPERRIGLSAHDFAQLMGAPEVILSRAAKIGGAPAVASRFVQRLAAVVGEARWDAAVTRGVDYVAMARDLDHAAAPAPIKPPEPRPPRAARPTALSVTDIEHWLRDPYTIYAKHILRLARLDPVDMPPSAADRGSAIHAAVGRFAEEFAAGLPPDVEAELLRIGREEFAALEDFPEARALWWPRFERIAAWLAAWEHDRRAGLAAMRAEIRGEIFLPLGDRQFRLYGRADRIERRRGGGYAILDFKTGEPPSSTQVRIGIAPQLTLEAAMLRRGGFPGLDPRLPIDELLYVRLKGGEPPGEPRPIEFKDRSPDDAAEHALAKLTELAARFDDEAMPYRSLVLPMWTNRYGTYDDLARVKEWSATGDEMEGEE